MSHSTGVATANGSCDLVKPGISGTEKSVTNRDDPEHYERHPYARTGDVPPGDRCGA
jgi:hypothetical protein